MKSICKKILVSTIIFIILFNFAFYKPVEAYNAIDGVQSVVELVAGVGDLGLNYGFNGIILLAIRGLGIVLVLAIEGLIGAVAGTFGYVDEYGNIVGKQTETLLFTPDNIFFNRILLTDINIFNITVGLNGNPIIKERTKTIRELRTNIALWYYIMRVIAVSILLCILIYLAIKMAISTIASDKAKYKQMLINWVSSIALVFVLHYFIVIVCKLNSVLVNMFQVIVNAMRTNGDINIAIGNLLFQCMSFSVVTSMASLAVCGVIIVQSFAFLIYYIKRMLTIAFLIIISPLITITYSIDKLGDGKAQALNTWMREFFFTIIIQPFHCIIYTVFMGLAISALNGNKEGLSQIGNNIFSGGIDSLVGGILAILCLKFIWDAEKMIKNIFGIKVSETLGDAVASAAVAGTLVNKGMKLAKGASKGGKAITQIKGKNNGTVRGLTRDLISGTKLGTKLGVKSSKEKEKERKDNLARIQNDLDNGKKVEKDIRTLNKAKKYANKQKEKAEKEKKRKNKITKFKKYLNENENGQRFKRVITQAPAVAAAVLGGGMLYGAGSKTTMLEAGMAGYGIYTGVDGVAKGLLNRKSNNYIDNIEDLGQTMQEVLGKPKEVDKDMFAQYAETATRMDANGDFKNLKDKADDAKDKIIELLKEHDKERNEEREDFAYKEEAEEIMNGLQNGIFNKNLDFEALAKMFNIVDKDGNVDAEGLRNATQDFAVDKIYKQIAQENSNVNTLAGDEDFYKVVLQAWKEENVEENETTNEVIEQTNNTESTTRNTTENVKTQESSSNTQAKVVHISEEDIRKLTMEIENVLKGGNNDREIVIDQVDQALNSEYGKDILDGVIDKLNNSNNSTYFQVGDDLTKVTAEEIAKIIRSQSQNGEEIKLGDITNKFINNSVFYRTDTETQETVIRHIENVFLQEVKNYTENRYVKNEDEK